MSGHKYETGQLVDYVGRKRASGVYKITQLLPQKAKRFSIASRMSRNLTSA